MFFLIAQQLQIRKYLHHFIVWYLKRCGCAFHTYPYGDTGRYVVLMDEHQYHYYKSLVYQMSLEDFRRVIWLLREEGRK